MDERKTTAQTLRAMKQRGEKIAAVFVAGFVGVQRTPEQSEAGIDPRLFGGDACRGGVVRPPANLCSIFRSEAEQNRRRLAQGLHINPVPVHEA